MPSSTATFATEHASRYLQQLCKHWGHRLEVSFTPEHGTIGFGDGRSVTLDAVAAPLAIRIDAPDQADLPLIEEHIVRFAFRFASHGKVRFATRLQDRSPG